MPLSKPRSRRGLHHRIIDMHTYQRDDGLYDVEAHLVDSKPFPFLREGASVPVPVDEALHDLWMRVTVDDDYIVRHIEAASDVTPWPLCKQAERSVSVLVGEKIARGWSAKVKERLRGVAGCTHLMEMLIPMATTALQGIRGIHLDRLHEVDAQGVPLKIDSCYSFGRQREVVKMMWPAHYVPPASS